MFLSHITCYETITSPSGVGKSCVSVIELIVRSLIVLSKWYIHEMQTKIDIQLKQFDIRYEKHGWFNIICEQ